MRPPAGAVAMAKDVARVVALDLPFGPSWLLPAKVETSLYDGEWCAKCHQEEYDAWTRSAHAHAAEDPFVGYVASSEERLRGPSYARLCQGCHDPTGLRRAKRRSPAERVSPVEAATTPLDSCAREATPTSRCAIETGFWITKGKEGSISFVASISAAVATSSSFLVTVSARSTRSPNGRRARTMHRVRTEPVSTATCRARTESPATRWSVATWRSHSATRCPGWEDAIVANLAGAAKVSAVWHASTVDVNVENVGAGHLLPTGVADIREMWIELRVLDAAGQTLSTVGGPDANGLLADDGPRFGMDIAGDDGMLLKLHELSLAKSIPFDRRIPPGGAVQLTVDPGPFRSGAARVEAHLFYRNLRPPFYRAALGDPTATPPTIELAKASVTGAMP